MISFPHATYIFLFVAGLVAVVIEEPRPEEDDSEARRESRAASLHAVRVHGDAAPRQGLAARR